MEFVAIEEKKKFEIHVYTGKRFILDSLQKKILKKRRFIIDKRRNTQLRYKMTYAIPKT